MTPNTRKISLWRLRGRLTPVLVAVGLVLGVSAPARSETIAQVGFSPDSPEDSARVLVLSVIDAAKSQIRMLSYSFTARDIVDALIRAKGRGVDVMLVVDEKGNRDNYSQKALRAVASAGIPVRLDSHYAIQHDKTIITDGVNVETGSFNFTDSAEKRNSENALVIWNLPSLAKDYLAHWQSRWDWGRPFVP